MDNFEDRYRAIVEKQPGLRHNFLAPYDSNTEWYDVHTQDTCQNSIARAAVCWWLAGKFPENIEFSLIGGSCCIETDSMTQLVVNCTDPTDAILTAWEIILGIKENP